MVMEIAIVIVIAMNSKGTGNSIGNLMGMVTVIFVAMVEVAPSP